MNAMINHLENYWDNIEDWWLSKETQDNIKKFNKNFNEKPNFFSIFKLKSKIQNHLENQ